MKILSKTSWLLLAVGMAACSNDSSGPSGTPDAAVGGDAATMDANADAATGVDAADDSAADAAIDAGPPTTLTTDELVSRLAAVMCERRSCFSEGDAAFIGLLILGEGSDCGERAAAFLRAEVAGKLAALTDEGRLVYDAEAALTCADLIDETPGCDFLESSCLEDVFVGQLGPGERCSNEEDPCQAGHQCNRIDGLDWRCEGVCEPVVGAGEPCSSSRDCEIPLDGSADCRASSDSGAIMVCFQTNYRNAGLGEPCGEVVEGYVTTQTNCGSGLECEEDVCVREAALPAAEPGQPCGSTDDGYVGCTAGAICMDVCRSIVLATEEEAPCGLVGADTFTLCDAFAGVVCHIEDFEEPEGECVALGDGELGDVCVPFLSEITGVGGCNAGLRCPEGVEFPVAQRCAPLLADDAECRQDSDCASGRCEWRDSATVCQPLVCEDL